MKIYKNYEIYIFFSDRTCAYPFYFPHPFLHVLSAFFSSMLCAVLESPMAYEKVMSGDIINLFLSHLATTNTKMVYYYENSSIYPQFLHPALLFYARHNPHELIKIVEGFNFYLCKLEMLYVKKIHCIKGNVWMELKVVAR